MAAPTRPAAFLLSRFATASIAAVVAALACAGCGAPPRPAIPATLDRAKVPNVTVEITAKKYEFMPARVVVKQGTLVHLTLRSIEGTHGFALPAYGLDETLEEAVVREISFYADEKGEYLFHCSHLCGVGHFGMKGTIVVE